MYPALAWRHHVAMGIERNRQTCTAAKALADHQIGDRHHAVRFRDIRRHGVALDLEAQTLEQFGRGLAVTHAIARRIVGRHAKQGFQKLDLARKVSFDEIAHGLNRSMKPIRAVIATPMS